MSSDAQSLFRQEVLAAKSDTLSGPALNIRPVSADRLTLFFAGLATIVLLLLTFASYTKNHYK